MPTLSPQTTPYYGGGQVLNPANVKKTVGAPPTTKTEDHLGTLAIDNAAAVGYLLVSKSGGIDTWAQLEASGGGGTFTALTVTGASTLTGTTHVNITGSAVTTIGTGGTGAVNIGNATGNTAVTGSLTASTSLTATLGNITATNGSFVASTAGTGIVFTPGTASGTTTATLNARVGQITITTPSIAGGATATMTITNSAITGSTTQVGYWLTGGTTGAALTIQSYANTAGQSVVTIQNGTGATTNTATLILNFMVLN